MSERASPPVNRRRTSVLLLGGLLLAVALVAQPAPSDGPALDPGSTGPAGLRGALDVLRALDVDVRVDTEVADGDDVALVLPGDDPARAEELAQSGLRVVSQTPPPDTSPTSIGLGGLGEVRLDVDCPGQLPGVRALSAAAWVGYAPLPEAADADRAPDGCLPIGSADGEPGRWLTVRTTASGGVHLHLGTLAPLVNARLADGGDDAGRAVVALLAPQRDVRVVVLRPAVTTTIADLVPGRVVDAVLLGSLAVALLAAARGRRLGAPVVEPLLVEAPAGELARALGDLRARADHRGSTTRALRRRTVEALRRRYRLPPDATTEDVAVAIATTTGADPDGVGRLLAGHVPTDDDGLVALAGALADLRATPMATTGEADRADAGQSSDRGDAPTVQTDRDHRPTDPEAMP